jgi:hypothetical protein
MADNQGRTNGLKAVPDASPQAKSNMTDIAFLQSLGVPVENIAKRAGRTATAILYEIAQEDQE